MRSVYAKISLWSFATLVVSLIAFLGVTQVVSFQASHRTGQFGRIQSMELEEAREAYEAGGAAKLQAFIDRLHRYVPGGHYLTDAKGRDILSGEDRSAMLAVAQPEGAPPRGRRGPLIVMAKSPDGLYRWVVEMKPQPMELQSYLPYYALIFGAVALVCWLLALNIASPLRALARTVRRWSVSIGLSSSGLITSAQGVGRLARRWSIATLRASRSSQAKKGTPRSSYLTTEVMSFANTCCVMSSAS